MQARHACFIVFILTLDFWAEGTRSFVQVHLALFMTVCPLIFFYLQDPVCDFASASSPYTFALHFYFISYSGLCFMMGLLLFFLPTACERNFTLHFSVFILTFVLCSRYVISSASPCTLLVLWLLTWDFSITWIEFQQPSVSARTPCTLIAICLLT